MSFRAFAFETGRSNSSVSQSANAVLRRFEACALVAMSFSFRMATAFLYFPLPMSSKKHSILIASNNGHKLQEFREIFAQFKAPDIELLAPGALGLTLDPDETAETYLDNARIKARAFHGLVRSSADQMISVMADDSGLEVDALGGAPGVRSARFHRSAPNNDGCAALLRAMAGVPEDRRTARFRACIVLIEPDGREYSFEGVCEGSIAFDQRGGGGFGFDPVFRVAEDTRHLAELSAEEKHRISHRGKAAQEVIAFLRSERFVR
jgi:XTP/dITP diphosphohydrolase